MLKIPFYRPSIGPDEINEVTETLKGGWLTTGPKTKQFEKEFSQFIGQEHSVALNSCTAGLHLALEAIGIGPDDGVLVPTMTFAATAEVVRYLGANPILTDCHESDFNLDVADAERRLERALASGQRVSAIMPVHYAGQVGDVSGVSDLAKRYGLKVIEDAAHCCPAYYRTATAQDPVDRRQPLHPVDLSKPAADDALNPRNGQWRPVGTSADISCFSFYANKCITTGEGGMACTNNAAYADRMRIMSLHGISRDAWKRYTAEGSWYYEITAPGYKYNLTDIASAIGLHQLRRVEKLHAQRREHAQRYLEKLHDVEELILPFESPDRIHSWHLFVTRLRLNRLNKLGRSELISELGAAGIGTSVHYLPLHMHPYYREKFGYRSEDLPTMARIYPELVTLPLFADLKESEVDYICASIKEIIARDLRQNRIAMPSPLPFVPDLPTLKVQASPALAS